MSQEIAPQPTEADATSMQEKFEAFLKTLTPAEAQILASRIGPDEVAGYDYGDYGNYDPYAVCSGIVAAGGGNIVAAGGGNIVAAGGGNLFGGDY